MNAFQQAKTIEEIARQEILPWLHLKCESVEDTGDSLWLQKIVGDFIVVQEGRKRAIELKAEAKYTGNLYLEWLSNKPRRTPGWMWTCQADYLLYFFCDTRELYVIDFPALWAWAFGDGKPGQIYKYAEKCQSKYDQINYTWGFIVPIIELQHAGVPVKKITAEQRGKQSQVLREAYDGIKF